MTGRRHAELSGGGGGNHFRTFPVADCAGYAAAIEEEMRVLEEIHALMGGMATDCYYPDIHLLKQSGKRTGDQITVIGKSRQSDGLGVASLPCSLNLYYFSGPENKGWHRLEQFEEWVLPYLKALFVVENGHQILAPQQVNNEVFDAFQLIYSWQNKGISSNFKQIPFSAKLKQKIIDHLWAKSWSGQIRPLNVELDIALFLEKPFFQLTQSLAKLGQTVAVATQKGTRTAVLYYMLNTGQKQAIAKISRRGAMIELEYLTAKNATTTEVVFELQNVTYLSPNKTEKIGNLQYIRNAGKYGWREVTGAGDVALDVATATEKQLDDIFAGLQNSPPYKYAPNTLEHKAERWAQYKIEKGSAAKDYSNWSDIYNSNMTKATKAHQAADEVLASIAWGQREVIVQAGTYIRRMDIADINLRKGVEVKSYETGKVYATQALKRELNADKFLVEIQNWQIEWVFKGCEPSQPLRTLLEQGGITIKLIQ